jgi:hypothetical protein
MICWPTIAMRNFVPAVSINRRLTVVRYDNIAGVVTLPGASYREEISTHRHANRAHFSLRHNTLDDPTIIRMVVLRGRFELANAQTRIGTANSVQPEASGSVAGTLSAGSGVHANETVRTGSSGRAGLQFHDQSNLSVGPSSQVRLDKFVYDPNKGTGSTVIEATRGTFRFTTGSQNKGEVKIKTPYGTLGTRG